MIRFKFTIMNHLLQLCRSIKKNPLSSTFYIIYIFFLWKFAHFPIFIVAANNFAPNPEMIFVFASVFYGYLLTSIIAGIFIGLSLINQRYNRSTPEKRFYKLLI